MTKLLSLIAPGVLLMAVAAAPAHATLYSSSFSGSVVSQTGTSFSVGNTVSGSFTYNSSTNSFLSYSIDGFSAAQPFASIATAIPNGAVAPYEAQFEALSSAAQQGTNRNISFTLDLQAITNFTNSTAFGILTSSATASQLATQANQGSSDPLQISTFSYNSQPASGGAGVSLVVALNAASLSTSVPEPASMMLLAAPVLAFAFARRR